MNGCGLEKMQIFYLAEGLNKNCTLQNLQIGDNNLGDPFCLKAISESLL